MQEYFMFSLCFALRSSLKIGVLLLSLLDLSSLNNCYSLVENFCISFPFCGSHIPQDPTSLVSALIDGDIWDQKHRNVGHPVSKNELSCNIFYWTQLSCDNLESWAGLWDWGMRVFQQLLVSHSAPWISLDLHCSSTEKCGKPNQTPKVELCIKYVCVLECVFVDMPMHTNKHFPKVLST